MPSAFFEPDGDWLVPTELTRGPWSAQHQHGGPPSALIVRAALKILDPSMRIARITLELLKPIPLTPLQVVIEAPSLETPPARARRVQRLEARLSSKDALLLRATILAIRAQDQAIDLPRRPEVALPDVLEPFSLPFFPWEVGYHRGIEVRVAQGSWGATPITAWMRPLVPLVSGEPTSAIERALVLADAESGIGPPLDIGAFTFLNPDLTVHFARYPQGEWLGLEVRSYGGGEGAGVAASALFDERGLVGRAAQSLLIERRA